MKSVGIGRELFPGDFSNFAGRSAAAVSGSETNCLSTLAPLGYVRPVQPMMALLAIAITIVIATAISTITITIAIVITAMAIPVAMATFLVLF